QAYLGILIKHQEAIISGNIDELEKTIKSEGALSIVVENYKNKIVNVIKDLSGKYLLKLKNYRLSDFITAVKSNERYDTDKLSKMQNSLTKMGSEIIKVNNQNKLLIDQARYLIKGTISIIVNENNVPILDRTI
ncbi:MAG TPA: hypothetical protein ENI57_12455, partial [Ignavibacteria bacterium]|nr:hypothetical protein [Ignavibacteria bacterium]